MIPTKKMGGIWECKDKYQCVGNKLFLKDV